MKKNRILILLLLSVLPFCGCGRSEGYDSSKNKLFTLNIEARPLQTETFDYKLKINDFTIAPQFDTLNLILLKDNNQLIKEYYNKFMINPALILTRQSHNWLSKQKLFKAVLPPQSIMDADYTLEGNVLSLYGDFTDMNKTKAVIEIQFYLIDMRQRENTLVFSKDYSIIEPLEENTAQQLIKAYEKAFEKILVELTNDISLNIAKKADK